MKKHLAFVLGFSFMTLASISQNRSIAFEHATFKELQQKALKEHKLIFIDTYTTWCGPCKLLAKHIFTNDTIADYFNAHFINAKFDMEKGEGIELAKRYPVSCYPTSLFIDGNGNLVHREAGYMPAKMFLIVGKTANDPTQTFSYYKSNYDTKKNEPEFLVKYIQMIYSTCMEPKQEVAYYFSMQKESDLSNETNWKMINEHTNEIDSREFKYLIDNKTKFEALYTKPVIDEKISRTAMSSLENRMSVTPFDEIKYNETKQKIEALNIASGKEIIFESDFELAKKNKNWPVYIQLAMDNVDTYYLKNTNQLNSIAWDFYENVSDKNALQKAESWAKKSVELEASYANMDTYASLLYKNDKKDLALSTANKAIELAKKENYTADDYKSTSELLVKIKAMK